MALLSATLEAASVGGAPKRLAAWSIGPTRWIFPYGIGKSKAQAEFWLRKIFFDSKYWLGLDDS
jgi:hypothetical protein